MNNKNITIIHFVHTLYGGVANVAASLMNYQHSIGYKPVLVYCVYDSAIESQLDFQVEKIPCQLRGFPGETMMFGMQIEKIYNSYKKAHPDEIVIVHAHNVQTVGAFCNLKNIPMICTLHGFNAANKSKRKIVSDFLYRTTITKLLKHNKKITAVSQAILNAEELKSIKGAEEITVIHNFSQVNPDNKKEHTLFNIGHVGDLSYEKGWDTFWKAYHLMPTEYKEKIRIMSAGREMDYSAEWIKEQTKDMPYAENIVYSGYVKNAKEDFISQLDILVLASRNEGLGLVQIEAMGYGIPVLGRDTGGICEVLNDGYNGFVIENEQELCEKFMRLFDDKKLYEALSENASATYSTKFTKSVIIEKYNKIYNQILEGLTK
jgi:glycosyltransferase involved in cell wall biosynthesis